jgi:ATP-dependent Clp protease ATP-binding subunit ClpC
MLGHVGIDTRRNVVINHAKGLYGHSSTRHDFPDHIHQRVSVAFLGARRKRAIQKYLEDPLAEEIINANLKEGDSIMVDYNKKSDEIDVKITKGKGGKKKSTDSKSKSKGDDNEEKESAESKDGKDN